MFNNKHQNSSKLPLTLITILDQLLQCQTIIYPKEKEEIFKWSYDFFFNGIGILKFTNNIYQLFIHINNQYIYTNINYSKFRASWLD